MDGLLPFRHPQALLALLLPAALLVWTWRPRRRGVALPVDHAAARPRRWIGALVGAGESLGALLLAVAIVLLAGPQRWDEPRTERVLTNIEFCVDVSGSMTAPFGGDGDRYDASMRAINDFLDKRAGDAFGLTFFGNTVLHWVPLTSDVSAFRHAPPFMRPDNLPYWFNGTSIGRALLACRGVLVAREEGDRMIVLVSDGWSSDLHAGRDEEVGSALRDDRIVVYAIHVADGEVPDPIVRITSMTGGDVFQPGDDEGLRHVFARIDQMQQARLETVAAEPVDDYLPWCGLGAWLLALGLVAQLGARATPW